MCKCLLFLVAVAAAAVVAAADLSAQDLPIDCRTLPSGFKIEVYPSGIENPRQMALSPSGTLFVSTRRAGNVYAVLDTDTDSIADRVVRSPAISRCRMAWRFATAVSTWPTINRVLRFDGVESHLESPPEPVVLNDGLPTERPHGVEVPGVRS